MKSWEKKEVKDAKSFGAKRTPRSGGLWFSKGDSKSKSYLIENKTSAKESYSITFDLWEKVNREALLSHRIPIVSLEFGKEKVELVVMSKDDFLTNARVIDLPKGYEWCDECEGKGYHENWTGGDKNE